MLVTGTRPIVWIIAGHQWLRACLRAELLERGFEALGYTEIRQALRALCNDWLARPQIIVLDLCDQCFSRYQLEILTGTGIPILVLGGALDLSEPVVQEMRWAGIMKRPFFISAVLDRIEQLARNLPLSP